MAPPPILVLSGGNALGAYHAGAWTALEAEGIEPGWVAGTSIGAVTAAIIAGNAPGRRNAALRRFWDRAAALDGFQNLFPQPMRRPLQYAQALTSRLMGRPGLFTLRPPDLTGADARPGLFDAAAMKRLIAELVDFERVNTGPMRLTVVATDLASGEERVFDTRSGAVGIDHIMASTALIPDFPPVEIEARPLVDGGFSANLPVGLVLDETFSHRADRLTVFAVDLFPSAAPLPRGLGEAAQRQNDLLFASQTRIALTSRETMWRGHEPGGDVMMLAYEALSEETALKGYDFAAGTLARRWAEGDRDMRAQVAVWHGLARNAPGLTLHPPPTRLAG
ncbi:MAG: patatin-like phospholipase family protein [Proteobacteria bacterium]|nr:patatin-like phospholipase family protein [Pseudomonadota bacterium]